MQVQQLMTAAPAVPESASLVEAFEALIGKTGSELYIVDPAGRLVGVVPDYELLKSRLLNLTEGRAAQLMTAGPTAVRPDAPLEAVVPLFRESRHQQVPVVADGRLVGCLRRADVLRWLCRGEAAESPMADATPALRAPRFSFCPAVAY